MQLRRIAVAAIGVILMACNDEATAPNSVDITPQAVEYTGRFWGNAIAAGGQHSCAIADDSTLTCWGGNTSGQSTVSNSLGPVLGVATGAAHTCVIKSDSTVTCWGASANQQLSLPFGLGAVKEIAAKGNHTCAIRADDTVACWGDNTSGQTNVSFGLGAARGVSVGTAHSCAIRLTDNNVVCWGANDFGQSSPSFALGAVQHVAAAETFTCAIKADGNVACWGANAPSISGQAVQIAAGQNHLCVVELDGDANCAGDSSSGQAAIPFALGTVTQLAGGDLHTCALKTNGVVACWGNDLSGQTAVPMLTRRFAPTAIFGVAPAVDAGRPFTISLNGGRVIVPNDTLSAVSAGVQYQFDCGTGGGYSTLALDSARACLAGAPGIQIVKGIVRDGQGDYTEYVDTVVINNGVPVAPSHVTTTVIGRTVTLVWSDNATNEDQVMLQRRTYVSGAWSGYSTLALLPPNVETYVDTAAAGTTYQYRLRACSEAGCGVTVSEKITTQSLPLPLDTVIVSVASGSSIRIDWVDSNANETRFELQRRTISKTISTQFEPLAQVPGGVSTYVDVLAWPGEQYYYRVRPCNAAGCAANVSSVRISIPATVPAAPLNATAPVQTYDIGMVSWTDASTNETYFKVLRRQNIGGVWGAYVEVARPAANSTSHYDLTSGYGTFQYRIQACNTIGCSLSSVTKSTTVVPDPVSIPG